MTLTALRYALLAAAWLLAALSLPLRCCDLNGFFAWRGTVSTEFFLRFLLSLPRSLLQDYFDPSHTPIAMGGHIPPSFDVAALDLAWLVLVLTGLGIFLASPILIHRVRTLRAHTALRCFLPTLLALTLTPLAPASWRYPLPTTGMYLLALAHLLAATALALPPKFQPATPAFPISIKE